MEDEDDEENFELFVDGERQADEDAMEDDTKFEDCNANNLRCGIRTPGSHPTMVMAARRLGVRRHFLFLVGGRSGLGLGSMGCVCAKSVAMGVYGAPIRQVEYWKET